MTPNPHFAKRALPPVDGVAVIYDLADFTAFFTQPDAHRYVPRLLNHVADAVTRIFEGGEFFWLPETYANGEPRRRKGTPLELRLRQRKFLGDGELFILQFDDDDEQQQRDLGYLFHRVMLFQNWSADLLAGVREHMPVAKLPTGIRFGIARGDLYELPSAVPGVPSEFVGVCINLASRLTKYCPGVSVIASARVEVDVSNSISFSSSFFERYIATKLRGFTDEIVYCVRADVERLSDNVRSAHFRNFPFAKKPDEKRPSMQDGGSPA